MNLIYYIHLMNYSYFSQAEANKLYQLSYKQKLVSLNRQWQWEVAGGKRQVAYCNCLGVGNGFLGRYGHAADLRTARCVAGQAEPLRQKATKDGCKTIKSTQRTSSV